VRKSEKIYRNFKSPTGVLHGSVPKPVAPLQFPAKPSLMTVVLGRARICTCQVCCGLQVVTAGMGLFRFCNSYLVRGQRAIRRSFGCRLPADWRVSFDT
jgi:hypothetical protein